MHIAFATFRSWRDKCLKILRSVQCRAISDMLYLIADSGRGKKGCMVSKLTEVCDVLLRSF